MKIETKCTYIEHGVREVGNDKIASLSYLAAGLIEILVVMAIVAIMVISMENIYLREALAGMAAIATLERFAATRMRGKSKLEELLAQPPSLLLPPPPTVESSILACQLDSYSASGVASLNEGDVWAKQVCEICETQHQLRLSPSLCDKAGKADTTHPTVLAPT